MSGVKTRRHAKCTPEQQHTTRSTFVARTQDSAPHQFRYRPLQTHEQTHRKACCTSFRINVSASSLHLKLEQGAVHKRLTLGQCACQTASPPHTASNSARRSTIWVADSEGDEVPSCGVPANCDRTGSSLPQKRSSTRSAFFSHAASFKFRLPQAASRISSPSLQLLPHLRLRVWTPRSTPCGSDRGRGGSMM